MIGEGSYCRLVSGPNDGKPVIVNRVDVEPEGPDRQPATVYTVRPATCHRVDTFRVRPGQIREAVPTFATGPIPAGDRWA